MHYKTFPRAVDGSNYPTWEEITLTEKEEFVEDEKAKRENITLMKQCIDEARKMMEEKGLAEYQTDLINIALSLFRKRASHVVYWKDNRCKEKFDRMYKSIVIQPIEANKSYEKKKFNKN